MDSITSHPRRQFLSMSLSAAFLSARSESVIGGSTVTSATSADLRDGVIQSDPTDPYIVAGEGTPFFEGTQGWETVPSSERKRTILNLHPDKLQSSRGVATPPPPIHENILGGTGQVRRFAEQTGLSAESQNLYPYLAGDIVTSWYERLPANEKLQDVTGNPIDTLYESAAIQANGEKNTFEFGGIDHIIPSPHIPDVLERDIEVVKALISSGFSDFYFDAISRIEQVDVSNHAKIAFQDYLSDLPNQRLSEIGINNPADFDISGHIEATQISNHSDNPVLREFVLFHFQALQEYMRKLTTSVHEEFPDRTLNLMGNLGSPELLESVYLADDFDTVIWEDIFTVPPVRFRDFTYKLGRAIGRFDKAAIGAGNLQEIEGSNATAGLDPSKRYPTLLRMQVGEAYASGGIRTIPMTGWPTASADTVVDNWVLTDGSVPEQLQSFIDFVWANQRFIKGDEPSNDVAVIYSFPTLLWQSQHYLWGGSRDAINSFRGACDICREQNFPYDVSVFGHPDLWPDEDQLERLSRYEVVILPAVKCISDTQLDILASLMDQGTTVIVSGGLPTHTELSEPRSDVSEVLAEHDNAHIFDSDHAAAYFNGSQAESLTETIQSAWNQIRLDSDLHIGASVRAKDNYRIVHLVNYEYDPELDAMESVEELDVDIRLPFEPSSAMWVSPQTIDLVDYRTTGKYTSVTVPRLEEWGFVVFNEEEDGSFEHGSEVDANESHENAAEVINQRRTEDREVGLVEAEVALRESNVAREYGDFELARDTAQRAATLGELAQESPVVGFDQSHGQKETGYSYNALENVRVFFDDFSYREITQWSPETFEDLDLLIAPPVKTGHPPEFGATDEEISLVEEFVEDGGRLLLMGEAGMASDTNDLATTFGFEFQDDGVLNQEQPENERIITAVQELAEPSKGKQRIRVRWGTSLSVADDVDVFAWYPEDSPGIMNESRDSAAGDPIMGLTSYGEGVVGATATSNHFLQLRKVQHDPVWLTDWETVYDILWRLASPDDIENAADDTEESSDDGNDGTSDTEESSDDGNDGTSDTEESSNDGDDGPSDTEESSDDDGSSDGTGPGFGLGAALTGLGGAGYLLKQRLDDETGAE